MFLAALALAAVLQDPAPVTVIERIEMTPEQSAALSVLSNAGREAGECDAFLPDETRTAFRGGAARTPRSAADIPEGTPLSLADMVFYSQFGNALGSPRAARATAGLCAGRLADARLLIEAQKPVIETLIALSPSETERPWDRIGQAAVDSGAQARSRPVLAPPAGGRAPGAVQTAPAWAEAPRVAIPAAAREARRAGWARIECVVTVEGRARDCRLVAESAEGFGFGTAALAAEDRYRFRPSTLDGQPVEARGTFTVQFRF